MLLKEPDPKTKIVEDLEFFFNDGDQKTFTLDPSLGDTADWNSQVGAFVFNIVPRPSVSDPDLLTTPAETVTIFKTHLNYIVRRERVVTDLTKAEKVEWMKTLQELKSTTVQ